MRKAIPFLLCFLLLIPTEATSKTIPTEETPMETEIETEVETEETEIEVDTISIDKPIISIQEQPQYISLGEFKITAYCPCAECSDNWGTQTATGAVATEGRTIAVDPSVIPYGTKVMFNGNTYIAEDCGGAIKQKKIDLYFDNHQAALEWGVRYYEVFIEN
jgi:3D (Asp-Asp-Asp) domain-containing protein